MRQTIILVFLFATNVAFADTAKYTFNLSVVTDWQTVQEFGGVDATKQALQERIDDASMIFEDQMQLKLVVSSWMIPSSQAEDFPYDDTQSNQLLNDLVAYREASSAQCAQGATILMTTRALTDNVVGISNQGSACWAQGAGIVEVNFGEPYDLIIFAHELGHILGASHDGDPNGSCSATPPGMYIMTPIAIMNSTNTFSPCSISVITSQFAQHACIQSIAPTTPQTSTPDPIGPSLGTPTHGGGAVQWTSIVFLSIVLGYTLRTKYRRQYANQARNRTHDAPVC